MNYIIIPEGLALNSTEPSMLFKAILNELIKVLEPEDVIFIAPANNFKTDTSEQIAAKKFLQNFGVKNDIHAFEYETENYLNTRDNAIILKNYLVENNLWPLKDCKLWSYHIHSKRAALIFSYYEYKFESIEVRPNTFKGSIVNRLFYYNYPILHRLYEFISIHLFRANII